MTDTHPNVPSKSLAELPELQAAIKAFAKSRNAEARGSASEAHSALPDTARQLLREWSLAPFTPLARLYDRVGRPSPEKDRAIREALTAGGYAEFTEIRIGKCNMALFEPRDAAWKLLGGSPIQLRGRGGIAHRHIAHWVASVVMKRGNDDTAIEWVVPSTRHAADVAWRSGEQWHTAEVIVGCEDNLVSHLETTLFVFAGVVESVTIISPQKKVLKQLRSRVEQCVRLTPVLDRIHYIPVESYLKELWP